MSVAIEIRVPRLGWSMEEGTFIRWLKRDGDPVRPGEAIYELEGDKATQEIESLDAGTLRIPPDAPAPGSVVSVGALLAYLVAEGEPAPLDSVAAAVPGGEATSANGASKADSPAATPRVAAAPAVRRLARELGVELSAVAASADAGRITPEDVRHFAQRGTAVGQASSLPVSPRQAGSLPHAPAAQRSSPRARRVAGELGIDWTTLHGSGRGGRVRERDVRQAAAAAQSPMSGAIEPHGTGGGEVFVAITPRRRIIAQRMLASRQQTAPVTLTTRADATNLVNLRNQFKESAGQDIVPSYSDIIVKLTAVALRQHPLLAARWDGERLVLPDANKLSIGIAVDTEDGLLAPVVRDVPALSLIDIARSSRELIERARARQLSAAGMQGGVFTITNLGPFGIDTFTPLINYPETAVLGLGAIRREAVADDAAQIVVRDVISLSLTFDHRVVDGAPAARFLQTLRDAIENPSACLLRGS
jgi:pyruvate dehydrogenase E2 component (dihydrolipoamide acetyltransferase)